MDDLARQIAEAPPTMRLDTKPGERVRFLGRNGYDAQLKAALAALTVGAEYEVLAVEVGAWESHVALPEGRFNTVMFVNAD